MAITAKDVQALRQATGLGMMECKKALAAVDGDMGKAKEGLRAKGIKDMTGRSDRDAAEGKVFVAVTDDQTKGVIVEVNSETDFTANTDTFGQMIQAVANEALKQDAGKVEKTDAIQALIDEVRLTTKENVQFGRGKVVGNTSAAGTKVGAYVHFTGKVGAVLEVEGEVPSELLRDLCMHITAATPAEPIAVCEEGVPVELLDTEKRIAKQQVIESGKPEHIADKIVQGKIGKFLDQVVLLRQPFVKDEAKKVGAVLPEGTVVRSFVRCQVGL